MDSAYLSIGVTVGIQLVVATAVVATVRQMVSDTKERVGKIEDQFQDLPKNYVPRSEVSVMLEGIKTVAENTRDMIRALLYGSREGLKSINASAEPMQYDLEGLSLTEREEALRLESYPDDGKGIWTIGWGHTGKDVVPGMVITRDQAVALLRLDTGVAVSCVNQHVHVPLSQHQFNSLVDFVFNEGTGHFLTSTLLTELNAGRYAIAASHFSDWVFAGGKRLGGLVRRRADEYAMFMEAA